MRNEDKVNYVVAVSGGVDSVVLLHKLRQKYAADRLVVAHFDHGMRAESAADARFVVGLAKRYGVRCEQHREELGAATSEAVARTRRYAFLHAVAERHNAALVTAHHADDVIESVAINFKRGTGWRGLAVMSDATIHRPLLRVTKSQLLDYAAAHRLEWVEDETNQTNTYLRNRIRRQLAQLESADAVTIGHLRSQQLLLRTHIEREATRLLEANTTRRRYFFSQLDDDVADELLRQLLISTVGTPLTRPQRARMWLHVKVARPGAVIELGEGVTMALSAAEFRLMSTT